MSTKIEPKIYEFSSTNVTDFKRVAKELDIKIVDIGKTILDKSSKDLVGIKFGSHQIIYCTESDYSRISLELCKRAFAVKLELFQKRFFEVCIITNESDRDKALAELWKCSEISSLERSQQNSEVQSLISKIDAFHKNIGLLYGNKRGNQNKEKEVETKRATEAQDSNAGNAIQICTSLAIDKKILSNTYLKEYHRFFENHFFGRYSASVGISGGHLQDSSQYISDRVVKGLQAATGSLPGVNLVTGCAATTVTTVNDLSKTKKAISLGSSFRATVFNNTCRIWAEVVTLARSEDIIKCGAAKLPLKSLEKTSKCGRSCIENVKDVGAKVLAQAPDTILKRMAFEDVEKIIHAVEEGILKEESSTNDLVTVLNRLSATTNVTKTTSVPSPSSSLGSDESHYGGAGWAEGTFSSADLDGQAWYSL